MRHLTAILTVLAASCGGEVIQCLEYSDMGLEPREWPISVSHDEDTAMAVNEAIALYGDAADSVGLENPFEIIDGDEGVIHFWTRMEYRGMPGHVTIIITGSIIESNDKTLNAIVQMLGIHGLGVDGITAEPQCIKDGFDYFLSISPVWQHIDNYKPRPGGRRLVDHPI